MIDRTNGNSDEHFRENILIGFSGGAYGGRIL